MPGEILRQEWPTYLKAFNSRNSGRAVDLQLLSEELGTYNEAEKFPFQGISLENNKTSSQNVEIMLGGIGADRRNLTHTVKEVRRMVPKTGVDGREEALEIEAADGAKIILVFKALPELPTTVS
jgi:hypothetical protein